MRKPQLDVYELSNILAYALDNQDWDVVELCHKLLQDHKRQLQQYNSKRK